jgi:hypothetical protein
MDQGRWIVRQKAGEELEGWKAEAMSSSLALSSIYITRNERTGFKRPLQLPPHQGPALAENYHGVEHVESWATTQRRKLLKLLYIISTRSSR